MKHYRIIGDDGQPYFTSRKKGEDAPAAHDGQPSPVEVPRLPKDFEDWDTAKGSWVKDHGASADHKAGPAAIAAAHAIKVTEARLLVTNGIDVDGVLAAEARALSIPLADLAGSVVLNARAALESEVARRVEKAKGKGKSNGN